MLGCSWSQTKQNVPCQRLLSVAKSTDPGEDRTSRGETMLPWYKFTSVRHVAAAERLTLRRLKASHQITGPMTPLLFPHRTWLGPNVFCDKTRQFEADKPTYAPHTLMQAAWLSRTETSPQVTGSEYGPLLTSSRRVASKSTNCNAQHDGRGDILHQRQRNGIPCVRNVAEVV